MRESLGLIRARKQKHTVETIGAAVQSLRSTYPKAGGREMVKLLFYEHNMAVPRSVPLASNLINLTVSRSGVVMQYFALNEPQAVQERRRGHFRRKRFWAAGVNDVWCVDQHDKWKYKFGLALHSGIDPFIGYIHWMKIWWTNSNPRLILTYYLDVVQQLGSECSFYGGRINNCSRIHVPF